MTKLELTTHIHAPIEICFDLARSIELNSSPSPENLPQKTKKGVWEVGHRIHRVSYYFGIKYLSESELKRCTKPYFYSDEMKVGPFRTFVHDHFFYEFPDETVMVDNVYFQSPWGFLGETADTLLLKKYIMRILSKRNKTIKRYAESDRWQSLIDAPVPNEAELSFSA
jgi:ligand-binding SRPBCC domain-containing protein